MTTANEGNDGYQSSTVLKSRQVSGFVGSNIFMRRAWQACESSVMTWSQNPVLIFGKLQLLAISYTSTEANSLIRRLTLP